jgi:hypothetical protein
MQRPDQPLSLRRSFLFDAVRTRTRAIRQDTGEALLHADLPGIEADERKRVLDQYRHMVGPAAYERAMERLATLTHERDIPVLLLCGTTTREQREVIHRVVARHGFEVLDIGPYTDRVLREKGIEDVREARAAAIRIGVGDSHPNALGHHIYAVGILEKLEAMGWPPALSP